MNLEHWRYYNHAFVSALPPHEKVDISSSHEDWAKLWKQNRNALFAKWTSDFDCHEETNWWFVIKDAPYVFDELSKSARKSIKRSLEKCYVKKIEPEEYLEDIHRIYLEAQERYKNAGGVVSFEENKGFILQRKKEGFDLWMGFEKETNRAIGYMMCISDGYYFNSTAAKYSTEFMYLGISHAINHTVLEYYLNEIGCKYSLTAERTILHETNSATYKIEKFKFRKAYCKLHIKYRPLVGFVVRVLFPFRKIFLKLDNIYSFHRINAFIRLYEIYKNK